MSRLILGGCLTVSAEFAKFALGLSVGGWVSEFPCRL